MIRTGLFFATGILLSGCAWLHHAQVGDIDDSSHGGKVIDIKVSETGINLQEAAQIAKFAARNHARDIDSVAAIVGLFQMGPRTGNMVFDEKYADDIGSMVLSECPSGHITNLMNIRETRKYPVVSGEIIKIHGWCKR